jgi:hypothetical protein
MIYQFTNTKAFNTNMSRTRSQKTFKQNNKKIILQNLVPLIEEATNIRMSESPKRQPQLFDQRIINGGFD